MSVEMPNVCYNWNGKKNARFSEPTSTNIVYWHMDLHVHKYAVSPPSPLSCGINWHEPETATGLRNPKVESSRMGTKCEWFFFSLAQKLMHLNLSLKWKI